MLSVVATHPKKLKTTKEHEETFGVKRQMYYLDCGDSNICKCVP